MCFTTAAPFAIPRRPGLSVTPAMAVDRLRASATALRRIPACIKRRPRPSHCVLWPDTARRFVEINPHRPAAQLHPP